MSNGFCGEIQGANRATNAEHHHQDEAEDRQPALAEIRDDALERRLRPRRGDGFERRVGHVARLSRRTRGSSTE